MIGFDWYPMGSEKLEMDTIIRVWVGAYELRVFCFLQSKFRITAAMSPTPLSHSELMLLSLLPPPSSTEQSLAQCSNQ
jgi:hypothetical protein